MSNPADVPVDLDDHDPDMDLNNPGIDEENDVTAPLAVKHKRLDHFDQMMAGPQPFRQRDLGLVPGACPDHQ